MMKFGAEEKKVIGQSWNGIVSLINMAYEKGLVHPIEMSLDLNSKVTVLDSLIKQILEGKDCGCDDKNEPVPQPLNNVRRSDGSLITDPDVVGSIKQERKVI